MDKPTADTYPSDRLRLLDIVRGTTVDGPGFRTSIYMAGCRHSCPGCHNPRSWDFSAGKEWSMDEIMSVIAEEDFDVTLSGGDPLYHPLQTRTIIRRVTELGHSTWVYTGFTLEEIIADSVLFNAVKDAEAIVDGRFIKELADPDLLFRGSSNQRIIYLKDLQDYIP